MSDFKYVDQFKSKNRRRCTSQWALLFRYIGDEESPREIIKSLKNLFSLQDFGNFSFVPGSSSYDRILVEYKKSAFTLPVLFGQHSRTIYDNLFYISVDYGRLSGVNLSLVRSQFESVLEGIVKGVCK